MAGIHGDEKVAVRFWRERARRARTVGELLHMWRENMGDTLKDDEDIIAVFRDRRAELEKVRGAR